MHIFPDQVTGSRTAMGAALANASVSNAHDNWDNVVHFLSRALAEATVIRDKKAANRRAALDELVRQAQELGTYE